MANEPRIVNGYTLLERLGNGGVNRTYKVKDSAGDIRCLKELRFGVFEGEDKAFKIKEMFEREAEAYSKLDHPQIPKLNDFFTQYTSEGEQRLYMLIDFMEGKNLAAYQGNGRLNLSEAADIGLQVLDILDYLHSRNPAVFHKDIKPSNLIRRQDGKLSLVDFGNVQLEGIRELGGSTSFGSYGYSPVEIFGGMAEARSDIYSLGATLFELVSGISAPQTTNSHHQLIISKDQIPDRKFRNLIRGMTKYKLEDRIDVERVRKELSRFAGRDYQPKGLVQPRSLAAQSDELSDLVAPSFSEYLAKDAGEKIFLGLKTMGRGFKSAGLGTISFLIGSLIGVLNLHNIPKVIYNNHDNFDKRHPEDTTEALRPSINKFLRQN